MSATTFDPETVVDASNCVLGRVASPVAERALDGETIAVVNAEDAVVTGSKEDVFETYRTRVGLGSDRGPMYPRRPDGILKRAIRGMLPHKRERGRAAFERVRVYLGNPFEADGPAPERIADAELDRLSNTRFVSVGEISRHVGANVTW